jgi:hypothetical protein
LKDKGIHIQNCSLSNPPLIIIQQGNTAILNYFREKQTQGVDHLYEAKLILVGEGRAGRRTGLWHVQQRFSGECRRKSAGVAYNAGASKTASQAADREEQV